MKGIILAGGSGTRLYPITTSVSKQLIPIYDKPMIYYPLSVLMLAGIQDILIITTKDDKQSFIKLLGDGSNIGCSITYEIQTKPNGLAEAFIIGEKFIGDENVALILGDNIFYGSGLGSLLRSISIDNTPTIFALEAEEPQKYGVVELDSFNNAISIEEKPKKPKSKYIIPGLYFYPNSVVKISKKIKPSPRGELEISSINNFFLEKKNLKVVKLSRGITWLDTGTPDSLSDAVEFVKVVQKRTFNKVACIEEVALLRNYITKNQLALCLKSKPDNDYFNYLRRIIS